METGRNSYTRIPNQLLSAVCSFSLSLNEVRLLLAIGRLSYGWSAEDTAGRASMKELQNITGLQANQLYVAIKGLKNKKVLLVTGGKQNTYRINACVDQWESAANCHKDKTAEGDESLPKSVTIRDQNQSRIVTKTSHESLPKPVTNHDQNQSRIVTKTSHESLLKPVTNHDQNTSGNTTFEAARQTPKEIKEIKERKERKERENLPPDYYQKTLKALGLPETAILAPEDHQTLIALFKENCNFDDIKAARIRRKKNKLSWIQDTVCEERDKRLAGFYDLQALQAEADRLYGGN